MINQLGPLELLIIGILSLLFIDPTKLGLYWNKFRHLFLKLKAKQSYIEEKLEQEFNQNHKIITKPFTKALNDLHSTDNYDNDDKQMKLQVKKLRTQSRLKIKEMTTADKKNASNIICQQILKLDQYNESKKVALYFPMENEEPDIKPLFEKILSNSKQLFLPAILDKKGNMEIRPISCLDNDLEEGFFGILQPKLANNTKDRSVNTYYLDNLTIFIPGLIFGINGERIGRGKGYYDRLLSKYPNATKIGLCFDCQLETQNKVPQSVHDMTMDFVITQTHIFKS